MLQRQGRGIKGINRCKRHHKSSSLIGAVSVVAMDKRLGRPRSEGALGVLLRSLRGVVKGIESVRVVALIHT